MNKEITSVKEKRNLSLRSIDFLSDWMDTKFRIPGTQIRFGVDAVLSLIPGVGDVASTGVSLGIFGMILAKGVPFLMALKMMFNIIVDFIISAVPFIGTIFDIGFKANRRNLHLLETHLENNPDGKYRYGVWWVFALTILILIVLFFYLMKYAWQFLVWVFG